MTYAERSPRKTKFYNSTAWRKLSHDYAQSRAWICERCGNRNIDYKRPIYKQLHCHHKIPLTDENIDNPDISLNVDNLILLCQKCHNAVDSEDVLQEGLYFDENGMVQKRRG